MAAIGNSARIIPFQGTLTNSTGANVADGNYSMTFKLYSVSSGGTALWSETQSSVAVSSGAFSVNIGTTDTNGVNVDLNTPPYYLGITIGANAEMTPRIQLGMAPFAMNTWSVPSGQVAFFNLSACPTGWTALTAAAGRVIVGRAANESIGSTVGTALTSLEDRTHTHTDPSHTHTFSGSTGGQSSSGAGGNLDGYHGVTVSYAHTHGFSGTTSGGSGGTTGTASTSQVIPYIQYLVCQKN